jgi:flavin-dependent dehydrogenase
MTTQSSSYDVVVVGARVAGAATARLLAAAGHDVVLVDRGDLAADPLSTHGLVRGGVVQLDRWGLLDDVLATGAPASRQVTIGVRGDEVTQSIKDSAGVDFLVAPRRFHLDRILLESAVVAGATVRLGLTARDALRDDCGRVRGVQATTADGQDILLECKYVVGADGLRSSTASFLGAGTRRWFRPDTALFYAYVDQVPWTGYEVHVAPRSFAGVFPTNDGQAAVWLTRPTQSSGDVIGAGSRRATALLDAIAATAPPLGERLREGRVVSAVRGIVAPPSYVRDAYGPGWALVGDAGYHRDPLTGHGITDAFRDAELLSAALHEALVAPELEQSALASYERSRDAALADVFRLTADLAAFPATHRFVELQKQLAGALDREAQLLASLPAPLRDRAPAHV